MSLKNHYKKKTCSNKCSKNTYVSLNKRNLVLVHYSGDENQYVPKCHGNKKISQERPYKRTCPSTIASIKEQVVNEYPAKVYKKMVVKSMSGEDQRILNPRDLQQVSNIKKRVDKANRLSHDDLYNLVELSYHLSDFVRNVTIFPDLLCMAASSNLLQELDRLLHLKSTEPVTLFYDTTFN